MPKPRITSDTISFSMLYLKKASLLLEREKSLKPNNSGLHKSLIGAALPGLAALSFLYPRETQYVLEKNNSNSSLCVIWYLPVIQRILPLSVINKRPPIHNVARLFQTPHLSRWHSGDGWQILSLPVAAGEFTLMAI